MHIVKKALSIVFFTLLFSVFGGEVLAAPATQETSLMGMHLMHPSELSAAKELISHGTPDESWQYVTITFTLDDIDRLPEWQAFFDEARELQVIPLVRIATRYDQASDSWLIPTRKDIVTLMTALDSLAWPTPERHVIIFNEVNHAKEWGNSLDPAGYADALRFAGAWLQTEPEHYVVLPAAMDLAAPNGTVTREAFSYMRAMLEAEPDVFLSIDAINSHSYPNPAFRADPYRTGQNSLRGFEHELAFFEQKLDRTLPVYITETGWDADARLNSRLAGYYEYAMREIWSHPQVEAVTPFVFRGHPGPFAGFSFQRGDGTPTSQYLALQRALERVYGDEHWLSQAR